MSAGRRRHAGMLGGGAVIVGAFAFLLYGGIEENLVYFLTPTELVARGSSAFDAPLRLGGDVEPGSVEWNAEALHLRFVLTDGETGVEVNSRGAPPQMFRDGMGVVVEGQFRRPGVFESHNLMVMHSNEYYPEGEPGAASPHGLEVGREGLPEGHHPLSY
jgi:cytochrome c-type biogenesis protein CcmE